MMRNALSLAAVASLAALAACAKKPAPEVAQPPTVVTPSNPSGPIPGSVQDFQTSVGDRVFFDTDQHTLRPDARTTLEKQAAWLAKYPNVRVLVAGSADERGTREYNLALGARRAASTKDYLVSLGVPAGRIETVSYGKERPIDGRGTEEAWSLNRNAQTQITSGAVS
jgi:peptidoglycan-associated lipoprotein